MTIKNGPARIATLRQTVQNTSATTLMMKPDTIRAAVLDLIDLVGETIAELERIAPYQDE